MRFCPAFTPRPQNKPICIENRLPSRVFMSVLSPSSSTGSSSYTEETATSSSEEDSVHTSDAEFIANTSDDDGEDMSVDSNSGEEDPGRLIEEVGKDQIRIVKQRQREAIVLAGGRRRSGRQRRAPQVYIDPDAARLMTDNGNDVLSDESSDEDPDLEEDGEFSFDSSSGSDDAASED